MKQLDQPRRLLLWCLLAAFLAGPLVPASPADVPADDRAEAEAPPTAEEAFAPLLSQFQRVHRSVQAMGGLSEADRRAVERLRERIAEFNEQYEGHAQGLGVELQLSIWLGEHERAEQRFVDLILLHPQQRVYRDGLARYLRQRGEGDRITGIYAELVRRKPEAADLRVELARQYQQQNDYHRALEVLDEVELNAAEVPDAFLVLSECLFAEHRFEEALEALDAIPQQVIDERAVIRHQVIESRSIREEYPELWSAEHAIREAEAAADDLPRAEIVVAERGRIVVELFENEAPNTVANFIHLAEQGFYDGTAFHRVIPNFMVQGGDPHSREGADGVPGQGGPGWNIPDEHDREDARMHFAGSLAMAKTAQPDTAGSQFYLTHTPTAWLNHRHTVFGRTLEGLDVVRMIEPNDRIEAVRVLRKRDHEYAVQKIGEEPETEVEAEPEADDVIDEDLAEPEQPEPESEAGAPEAESDRDGGS